MCSISERAEAHTKDLHLSQWAQDVISDLQSQLAALREENERLRGRLKELEWDGWDGKDYCYVCEATKEDGHKPDCWLGKECAK